MDNIIQYCIDYMVVNKYSSIEGNKLIIDLSSVDAFGLAKHFYSMHVPKLGPDIFNFFTSFDQAKLLNYDLRFKIRNVKRFGSYSYNGTAVGLKLDLIEHSNELNTIKALKQYNFELPLFNSGSEDILKLDTEYTMILPTDTGTDRYDVELVTKISDDKSKYITLVTNVTKLFNSTPVKKYDALHMQQKLSIDEELDALPGFEKIVPKSSAHSFGKPNKVGEFGRNDIYDEGFQKRMRDGLNNSEPEFGEVNFGKPVSFTIRGNNPSPVYLNVNLPAISPNGSTHQQEKVSPGLVGGYYPNGEKQPGWFDEIPKDYSKMIGDVPELEEIKPTKNSNNSDDHTNLSEAKKKSDILKKLNTHWLNGLNVSRYYGMNADYLSMKIECDRLDKIATEKFAQQTQQKLNDFHNSVYIPPLRPSRRGDFTGGVMQNDASELKKYYDDLQTKAYERRGLIKNNMTNTETKYDKNNSDNLDNSDSDDERPKPMKKKKDIKI